MSGNRFSRRTVLSAIEVMESLTQAQLSRYLLELGPQFPQWVGNEGISVTKRLNNLMQLVDQDPHRVTDEGELLREKLVEKAASLLKTNSEYSWQAAANPSPREAAFLRALELDGFTATDRVVRRTLPAEVHVPQTEDELVRLLKKYAFVTASGHLDQALDAHGRGNWAAANGQIRSFIESMLDEIAAKLDSSSSLPSGHARRAKLASLGFLSRELNEWDDSGKGFMNGLLTRLHPQGAHPGLSDEADSTFRLHIVLFTARLLLSRFDTRLSP
jgi:hypothetical protein